MFTPWFKVVTGLVSVALSAMKQIVLMIAVVALVGCGDGGKETAADAKGSAEAKKITTAKSRPREAVTSAKAVHSADAATTSSLKCSFLTVL